MPVLVRLLVVVAYVVLAALATYPWVFMEPSIWRAPSLLVLAPVIVPVAISLFLLDFSLVSKMLSGIGAWVTGRKGEK